MRDVMGKMGATLLVAGVGVLAMLAVFALGGCDGPITGETIIAPYGLEIVELDRGPALLKVEKFRGIRRPSKFRLDSRSYIYHVRKQGDTGTLTWGGKHSLLPVEPFTAAQFELMWPGLLEQLGTMQ